MEATNPLGKVTCDLILWHTSLFDSHIFVFYRIQIFRIPQLVFYLIGGLICQVILINTSYQDMVIPDIMIPDSSSPTTYTTAMNPTFSYPLKFGGTLCYPHDLSQCIDNPSSSSSCCKEIYDEESWPTETITVLEEFLIIFFTVLTMTMIRLQLWKINTQRYLGTEYCNKYWGLIVWDTLLGVFLAFEYSYFVTNYLKNSVSAPRPFYYAAKIYGSIHSDHRAPLRGWSFVSLQSKISRRCYKIISVRSFCNIDVNLGISDVSYPRRHLSFVKILFLEY